MIGKEHQTFGDFRVERKLLPSSEGSERIITEDGYVELVEGVHALVRGQADSVKKDTAIALGHIVGNSPENIAFMEQSGVKRQLEETDNQIGKLVIITQEELDAVAVDI